MTTPRRCLGWFLLGGSLLLCLLTIYCFGWQPDHFAAFAVLPIWVWGGCGLLLSITACHLLRGVWAWAMCGLWIATLLVGADEACVLTHFGKSAPARGAAAPHDGKPVVRVASLNCALFALGDPTKDLAAWKPDIVLLQDIYPNQLSLLAKTLYGKDAAFSARDTSGIVTRWKIKREVPNPTRRDQQATITMPDGTTVEVVNVHLATAATDLRLWQRTTWREHRINRALRMHELSKVQQALSKASAFPHVPTIFGGDFNAPASDVVHHQLGPALVDAFGAVGTGWGDTYHRRFPILRIDHLYATRHFTPVRCQAVTTRSSDHRMLVADFTMP